MTEYSIRPATDEIAEYLIPRLRQADIDEMWAAHHLEPSMGVWLSLAVSRDTSYAGFVDDEPVCLFGVALPHILIPAGRPWMVGTDQVPKHSTAFLRMSREHVKKMSKQFPYMFNFVDDRHKVAIRWLRWLGFTVEEPAPYGAEGLPFRHFYMREFNV